MLLSPHKKLFHMGVAVPADSYGNKGLQQFGHNDKTIVLKWQLLPINSDVFRFTTSSRLQLFQTKSLDNFAAARRDGA